MSPLRPGQGHSLLLKEWSVQRGEGCLVLFVSDASGDGPLGGWALVTVFQLNMWV